MQPRSPCGFTHVGVGNTLHAKRNFDAKQKDATLKHQPSISENNLNYAITKWSVIRSYNWFNKSQLQPYNEKCRFATLVPWSSVTGTIYLLTGLLTVPPNLSTWCKPGTNTPCLTYVAGMQTDGKGSFVLSTWAHTSRGCHVTFLPPITCRCA